MKTKILLESGTNELEIVEFQIRETDSDGQEIIGYYGVNVAKVREIIRCPQPTIIPHTHPAIEGVFNFRGRVMTLVNLGKWLGKQQDYTKTARVIVMEFYNVLNGFLVHAVSRIHRVSWEQVDSPDSMRLGMGHEESIVGTIRFENRIVMLIDFEKIVSEINPNLSISVPEQAIEDLGENVGREQLNILIVDDSAMIRRLLNDTLTRAGFNVIISNNGQDAYQKLVFYAECLRENTLKTQDKVDLVVTDIEMPQMDGLHLVKRMKGDDILQKLPVILFSSMGGAENRLKAKRVGADGFISKPEISILISIVDNLLGIATEEDK